MSDRLGCDSALAFLEQQAWSNRLRDPWKYSLTLEGHNQATIGSLLLTVSSQLLDSSQKKPLIETASRNPPNKHPEPPTAVSVPVTSVQQPVGTPPVADVTVSTIRGSLTPAAKALRDELLPSTPYNENTPSTLSEAQAAREDLLPRCQTLSASLTISSLLVAGKAVQVETPSRFAAMLNSIK